MKKEADLYEKKSDQGGIERMSPRTVSVVPSSRRNQTKVGLKVLIGEDWDSLDAGRNQTKVGLKALNPLHPPPVCVKKSDQGGIERTIRRISTLHFPRRNQTKVGLKESKNHFILSSLLEEIRPRWD